MLADLFLVLSGLAALVVFESLSIDLALFEEGLASVVAFESVLGEMVKVIIGSVRSGVGAT